MKIPRRWMIDKSCKNNPQKSYGRILTRAVVNQVIKQAKSKNHPSAVPFVEEGVPADDRLPGPMPCCRPCPGGPATRSRA
jgi:hypothetical protein